ncbi:heat shock transcription factor, X-linked member 3-like [Otolemur garnettii]|uniref:heat shock transcription factor, X-linked member 3-like n=1 Tax=Otolemur garnettii TaxID=30611 RepID=UPI000C7F1910|nr:heat shock transcription factor, X-linked member 3-like [Otolemur garnettii]
MASQNMEDKCEDMQAPTIGGEPENWVPPDTSTDPEVESKEDMDEHREEDGDKHGDEDVEKHRDQDAGKHGDQEAEKHGDEDAEKHGDNDVDKRHDEDADKRHDEDADKCRDEDADKRHDEDTDKRLDEDANKHRDEDMVKHSDEDASQNQGSQDNVQSEDQNENVADVTDNINFSGLSFPQKLWMIVENKVFKSVNWSDKGDTMVIEEDLFQREILRRRGTEKIFETDSLKSFIRQLNLYGFRKIRSNNSSVPSQGEKKMMVYQHSNFQRDKPHLLEKIQKKGYFRNTTLEAAGGPAMKKKKLVATRHSLRIRQNNAKKEAKQKSQKGAPSVQGTSGTQSFMCSGISSMRSTTGYPQGNRYIFVPYGGNRYTFVPYGASGEGTSSSAAFTPIATASATGYPQGNRYTFVPYGASGEGASSSAAFTPIATARATGYPQGNRSTFEPHGPSGEGASSSATFTPIATARMESTREGSASPEVYPEYDSILTLYNTCYAILLAALSVMGPNEPPESEEPEGPSDYKCALCERFKDNPNPNP